MRRLIALLLVVGLLPFAGGCYRHYIVTEDNVGDSRLLRRPAADINRVHIIGVIELDETIALDSTCERGVDRIYQRESAEGVLISLLLFIFGSRNAEIQCK